jgi:molybdate transport system ATP-binding protein
MTQLTHALQSDSIDADIQLSLRLKRSDFELDVSVAIPAQGTTVLFGPSGGGKTTILRAIAGLEPEVQGDVRIKGHTWQTAGVFVAPHARRVGFVFQHAGLLPHLSVEQNLRYGFNRVQGTETEFRACVEPLDLQALMHRKIAQLSGGERQRVAMGRALLTRPEVLLMDEPHSMQAGARRCSAIWSVLNRSRQSP